MRRILVTGGAGFIGSHFVRRLLREHPEYEVINVDKLTYAGNRDNLRDVEGDPRYRFVQGDICDRQLVDELVVQTDAIVSLAAETHVDRSLLAADAFIRTDVQGTHVLLCAAREHGIERFVYVSTDEVYGEAPEGYSFGETDPLQPRNPYAASKAAAKAREPAPAPNAVTAHERPPPLPPPPLLLSSGCVPSSYSCRLVRPSLSGSSSGAHSVTALK